MARRRGVLRHPIHLALQRSNAHAFAAVLAAAGYVASVPVRAAVSVAVAVKAARGGGGVLKRILCEAALVALSVHSHGGGLRVHHVRHLRPRRCHAPYAHRNVHQLRRIAIEGVAFLFFFLFVQRGNGILQHLSLYFIGGGIS